MACRAWCVWRRPFNETLTHQTLAVDFFNHLNMLYGTVTEFCTTRECPIMSAGPRYEYLWEDGAKYKKPTKLPAPEYVDALMNWAQNILDDENVFPNKIGTEVPLLDFVLFHILV
ncbi:Mob1/phocein [Butyriboletus roseoflavus]|nr:Mob1/phocein [Butyriboletus roseoflavus]